MTTNHNNLDPDHTFTLRGQRLILERTAPEHANFILESFRQRDFWRHYRASQRRNYSREQLLELLRKEQSLRPEKLQRLEWVIHKKSVNSDIPIGFACLADFNPTGRKAEYLVGIVNSDNRSSGMALEASLLVFDYAFNVVKLNKLVSYVYTENKTAQTNTLALGFIQEGLLREHVYDKPNNTFLSVFQNGMLASEFRRNKRLRKFSLRLVGRDITQPRGNFQQNKPEFTNSDWTVNVSIKY